MLGADQSSETRVFLFLVDKQKYVEKFKSLYCRKTGKDLSDEEASDLFEKLVVLVAAVYKPISKNYGK